MSLVLYFVVVLWAHLNWRHVVYIRKEFYHVLTVFDCHDCYVINIVFCCSAGGMGSFKHLVYIRKEPYCSKY